MWQPLVDFLVPMLAAGILQWVSSTMAVLWTGRLISTQALGAVSAVLPVVVLLVSSIAGVSSGGAVLIGHAVGAGDRLRLKSVAGTVLCATLLLSVLVAVGGTLGAPTMLRLLGTPSDIAAQAGIYVEIVFLSMPVLATYAFYTTILAGTGDSKTPLRALLISTLVAASLAPVLLLGWFSLPRLGVAGVAAAGTAGNAVALAWLLLHLRIRNSGLQLDRELLARMRVDWNILWKVVRIGVPTVVSGATISLAEIAILSFVNRFGSNATASYGAIGQVLNYALLPGLATGAAASVFSARLIGAQRLEEIGKLMRAAVVLNYAIGVPAVIACYACAWSLLGIFITDAAALRTAHESLTIVLWAAVAYGNTAVLTGVMRGSGAVVWPSIIGMVAVWGLELPAAFVLMQRFGLDGVWMGAPIGICGGLAMQFCYYELVWKRRAHQRL